MQTFTYVSVVHALSGSLDVLDLLAYLLQFGLDIHDIHGYLRVHCFDATVFTSRPISCSRK